MEFEMVPSQRKSRGRVRHLLNQLRDISLHDCQVEQEIEKLSLPQRHRPPSRRLSLCD